MSPELVAEKPRVSEREALEPAVEGLATTLTALSPDSPDYSLLQRMHRLLAGDTMLEIATPRRVSHQQPYPEAVQPAIDGLKATYGQLEPGHWARLAIQCHHRHLRLSARHARRNGGHLPPRDPEGLI